MIFTSQQVRLILAATKTQVRLPATGQRPPRPGQMLPIHKRHNRSTGDYVELLRVRDEQLGEIERHPKDLRAEGHKTLPQFADMFMTRHDRHWPPMEPCPMCEGDGDLDCPDCWVSALRQHPRRAHLCPNCKGAGYIHTIPSDAEILEHFKARWRIVPVYVLEFRLADRPRYLAHPVPGTSGDYTTNPGKAIDELEVIDPGLLRPAWETEARRRHTVAHDRSVLARQLRRRLG